MQAGARVLQGLVVIAATTACEEVAAQVGYAEGRASAEIVAPLTVTSETDLEFGTIVSSSQPGTVTVSPLGEAITSGGSRRACCKISQAARFSVDGEAGRAYTISIPTSIVAHGVPVSGSGASAPDLVVDSMTVRTASRPEAGASGVLDRAGKDWFGIGGTLHVPSNVPPAIYKATVPVTIDYG